MGTWFPGSQGIRHPSLHYTAFVAFFMLQPKYNTKEKRILMGVDTIEICCLFWMGEWVVGWREYDDEWK